MRGGADVDFLDRLWKIDMGENGVVESYLEIFL